MKDLLVAEHVFKSYGDYQALKDISLQIPKESVFGLLGPNGAGKTTFIRVINQILLPDSGVVFFDGEPLNPSHIGSVGYMPEERGLYRKMKVGEQVLYLARLKGISKVDAKERLKHWFVKFGIESWWDKKIQELSKGMAQKVQFIVTVLHKPKLLIFDEPFSGFDPVNANVIKDEILKLRDKGATVIFSTHRMESVEELCDHIALIHKSEKILDGNLKDVKRAFKTNTFQVGVDVEDKSLAKKELANYFEIEDTVYNSIYEDLKLMVKLNKNQTPNDLVQKLTHLGGINHFIEVIPSVNDIFIQSVS